MTSRNLNQTWRDIVFKQYEEDHAVDVPFPVSYLIKATEWTREIVIEIPTKIDPPVFRQAVLHFVRTKRFEDDPAYEDDLIKVRLRIRPPRPYPSAQSNDYAPPQDDTDQSQPGAASNSS